MPATSWEDQLNRSSRIWKRLLLLLLLFFAAGIIINNNRDIVFGKKNSGKGTASSDVSLSRVHGLPRAESEKRGVEGAAKAPSSPSGSVRSFQSKPLQRGSTEIPKQRKVVPIGDSLLMEDIRCRVLNRDDLRIHCAIMLYYKDARHQREIIMKLDALKVMARKVIGEMELESIKIDKITPAIFKSMSAIFDTNPLTTIAIRALTVEEVSRK